MPLSATEQKKLAAQAAVDEHVTEELLSKSRVVLGIGSGSTIVFAVKILEEKLKGRTGLEVICVPTSFQARQLILDSKAACMRLGSLEEFPELDLAIDGADEVDKNLALIKGGGGCLTQEKIVAFASKKFVVIADESKDSQTLGSKWKKGVPVEVIPMSYTLVQLTLKERLGANAVPLRMATQKAGPVVTDNGNLIIDADFGEISDPAELEKNLISIPGVVATGLFINMAHAVHIASSAGKVLKKLRNSK